MYVGQGIGAKHPIRYGCIPEISRFTLVRSGVDASHDRSTDPERQVVGA
jgi:hypothetical protein